MRSPQCSLPSLVLLVCGTMLFCPQPTGADDVRPLGATDGLRFRVDNNTVFLFADGQPLATYSPGDEQTPRPFLCNVRTLSGAPVTRPRPLTEGEFGDHPEMHPGIWLAFGDLNGADCWRLKAPVTSRFDHAVRWNDSSGEFIVNNAYSSSDGTNVIARERCAYRIRLVRDAWLLSIDSQFTAESGPLVFGDQEEMGLGVRLPASLAEKSKLGGRVLDGEGRQSAKAAWGKAAEWCDYSGPVGDKLAGVTIVPAASNFRPVWWHVRDYGLMVANPFGRKALTGGEASRVVVQPGEEFRLRFDVIIHDGRPESVADVNALIDSFELARTPAQPE